MSGPGLVLVLLSGLALAAAGCGPDLGTCEQAQAEELVYSAQGMTATKGQALMHDSCGQGAFCHSSQARGSARYGAPAGMNFDMLPSPSGWPNVIERRGAIWDSVRNGDMPPGRIGDQKTGHTVWLFDSELHPDAPRLPALASTEGKAVLRNWLACNAPIVSKTRLPSWSLPGDEDAGSAGPADFGTLYARVFRPSCALSGCHDASSSGGLNMSDECDAYHHLLQQGACGLKRVVPGDDHSLLVSKLETRTPSCGGGMPVAAPLPSSATDEVRAWVEAGAPAKDCQ